MRQKKTFIATCTLLLLFTGLICSRLSASEMRNSVNGSQWDRFGSAVALNEQYAVIGAPANEFNGDSSGSAELCVRNGDQLQPIVHLIAYNAVAGDLFGTAVAINGEQVLIGAPGCDDNGSNSGAAYIFQKTENGWVEICKLTANNGQAGDLFGSSVALDGNFALVGAPTASTFSTSSPGFAVLFQKSGETWNEVSRFSASDGSNNNKFGAAVALQGDTALIGAPQSDDGAINTGATYIFKSTNGNWGQSAKLTPSAPLAWDSFGAALSLAGDYALIGAPAIGTISGTYLGYATIFKNEGGTWTEKSRLTPDDGTSNDRFGNAVALYGDLALIGSPLDDDYGEASGSAYIFQKNGENWPQVRKIAPPDTGEGDQFGFAVALNGDYSLIGIPGDGTFGEESGSAVFDKLGLISDNYFYYIPVYLSGNGNWTGIGLHNLSNSATSNVTVTVYSQNGTLLATESYTIPIFGQHARAIAANLTAEGWMQVSSSTPLAGLCFLGSAGFMADIPVTTSPEENLLIPHIAQNDDWNTTTLICNSNATPTTVTMIYTDTNGQEQGRQSYQIPALGSNIYPLSEVFSNLLPLSGSVQLIATPGISAFALYSNLKIDGCYFAGINAVR